jgi:type II secretory pathway pseudopilin PulG
MIALLVVALFVTVLVAGAVAARSPLRRARRLRALRRAEETIEGAIADGRLGTATGEAVLQHLEGLRRACADGEEG